MQMDMEAADPKQAYRTLISLVVPRPIALVTTLSPAGRRNAAPFSFFNLLGYDPLVVGLGLEWRPDGSRKDTARNIGDTGEFTVNLVDEPLAARMNVCAIDFPADTDEVAEAGLDTEASLKIAPPRLREAPASLECRLSALVQIGERHDVALGEVVALHVRGDLLDDAGAPDPARLRMIGRMGGSAYTRTGDLFDMPRIGPEDWPRDSR